MYSQAGSWALKRCLREAGNARRVERWSFRGAPQTPDVRDGEEPEDHKRFILYSQNKVRVRLKWQPQG